ncbi:unnamed protein product [Somion occarium]|uniref:Uncharacterized protein n=1 Tax=Somion occarium TaxID=3059160 RepID=A0ABP1DUK9_9APHY
MVDWNNPEVVRTCAIYLQQSFVFVFAIYLWEYLLTFANVEGRILTRKMRFRPVLIPYLLGRYVWLASVIAMWAILALKPGPPEPKSQTATEDQSEHHCSLISALFSIVASLCVVCASTNLLIRTVIIWRGNRYIAGFLVLACAGHWLTSIVAGALEGHNSQINPDVRVCEFRPTSAIVFYMYTLVLDLAILALTLFGLCRRHILNSGSLWVKIYKQGIFYFVAAFLVNVPMLVLVLLDLNPVMNVICAAPGVTVSIIASSRAVTSLLLSGEPRTIHATSDTSLPIPREQAILEKDVPSSRNGLFSTNIELAE